MKKYIFTFGSDQLEGFAVNPTHVAAVVEAENMSAAREIVFESIIGGKFCTSYPYDVMEEFKNKYSMYEISLDELLRLA